MSTFVAMAVAMSTSALAQADVSKVDVNLKDAEILAATKMLTTRTGIQFMFEPSTEPFEKITLKVDGVSPEEAIRYICQAANAEFRRDERGVFIIGHRKPKLPENMDPTMATNGKVAKVWRKIRVLKAGAHDVFDAIMYNAPFSTTRGFEELKRFQALATSSEPTRPIAGTPQIFGNTLAQSFSPVGAMPSFSRSATTADAGNGIVVPASEGEGAGQIGGFGGGRGGGGGLGGAQGGGIGGGGLGGGQNGQNGGGQLVGGQGLVPDGIDFVSYDPTDNSLVVQGTEEAIQELQTRIGLFDNAPRQVLVKVEFITTVESIDRTFGTEFLYQRGTVNAGTRPGSFVRSADPVFVNYASGNVTGRLRASLVEGRGKVVSAPIIRTLNNQPATLTASVTQYIFINNVAATNGVVINAPTPYPITASTYLTVAPRINDDNTITMYLTPFIGSVVGTSVSPDGSELPNIATQSVAVVARVRNGETMVLGGLTSKNEDNSVQRVPVLADLPIIGQFFRTNSRSKTTNELLIFVTPTIVDEDTTGNPGGP